MRKQFGVAAIVATVAGLLIALPASPASARTAGVPFSADALPTWQTNATAWAVAGSGGKAVVGGQFTQIRPGAGQSGSARSLTALAILNAATGEPDSCQLPVVYSGGTAIVYAATTAPDGNTVFIGGNFTSVGGVSVSRLAEIDVINCRVTSFRPPAISSYVESIAVTGDSVYFGGLFQTVGGVQHRSFAKVNRSGALQSWTANASGNTVDKYTNTVLPDANSHGTAIAVSPDGTRVILGGDFFTINGTSTHSIVAVDATSGTVVRAYPNLVGNTSRTRALTSDGTNFYMGNEGSANFDGTMSFSWSSLNRNWTDNCQGAEQALLAYQGMLFQAHHHHDCSAQGLFPDGRRTYASVTLATDPAQRILGWLPELNDGTGEGLGGRGIAVSTSGGTPYLWYVGEFTRVNGANQQGLTRFSPNDTGNPAAPTIAARAITPGAIQVSFKSVVDSDDEDLTYAVYKGTNTTTPVWTGVVKSQWWYRPQGTFVDTSVTPGTSYSYRVRTIDAAGNQSALSGSVSATALAAGSAYATTVIGDNPRWYYRYDDISGSTWVIDSSGTASNGLEGIAVGTVTRSGAGALNSDGSVGATFSGADSYVYNDVIAYGPSTYSIETWINTTSTTGGALVDYGNGRPRSDDSTITLSSNTDRVLYLDSTGRVQFGANSGGRRTIRSGSAYNDGQWHHIVGTQSSAGMRLYIDGALIGQNTYTGNTQSYGSWHVGGDNLNSWPNVTNNNAGQRYYDGRLDETAVYYSALTAQQVAAHYAARTPTSDGNAPSTPSGVSATSPSAGNVAVTWTASTDNVGVAGYRIYRGSTAGFTANDASLVGQSTTTSFAQTGVAGGTWYYRVAAFDAAGNASPASSAASVSVTAPADTTPPSTPSGVAATSPSSGNVSVTWVASTDNVGVTGYRIYRGTTSGFTATDASQVGTATASPFGQTGVAAGTWYYRVAAVDAAGNVSTASSAATVTVATPPGGGDTAVDVQASADTMVAENNPAFVYGTSNQLSSRQQTGANIESYLRFALPATPSGSTLTGATLRIVTSSDAAANSAGAHQVRLVSGSWDESTTTWSNRATTLGTQLGELSGAPALSTAYTVSLTASQLTSFAGGSLNLALTSTSTDNLRIWSREYTTAASRPILTLSYTTGGGGGDTQAPSQPAGLSGSGTQAGTVSLSWTASTDNVGVTGYRIYRGTTSGFTANAASQVGTSTGTSFSQSGVAAGTWYYRVAAVDAAANVSTASNAAAVVVPNPPSGGTQTTVTVGVTLDTMVAQNNPAFVYGTSNQLSSRQQSGADIQSYLRFAIPTAPAGGTLTGATLRLVTSTDATANSTGSHQVQLLTGAWDESATTWNNRATTLGAQVGQLASAPALSTAYTITLDANQLAAAISGGNLNLALTSTSTDNLRVWSREAPTAANRPTLTLTYTIP